MTTDPVASPDVDAPPPAPLRGLVMRGMAWMLASQVSIQVLAFSAQVVVAHFLAPREYGLAAAGIVFVNLAVMLADAGFAATLVQRERLSEDDISTAFWANAAVGVVVTIVAVAASWPIARLYGEPRVQPLFAAMAPMFLLSSLGIVQGALLTRDLRFRELELRTITATTASIATVITLAALGAGPWAIVAQSLVNVGVSTLLLWRSSTWRPTRRFSRESLRSMLGFSTNVLGSRLLTWGRQNSDNLMVGSIRGSAALGSYAFAFNLIAIPTTRIAGPIAQVFFPAFSRLRDREAIGATWLRTARIVAAVVVPLMLGVVVVAPEFVAFVWGSKWNRSIRVLQVLAPLGMLQALQALNYGVLQAIDRTRTLLRYTLAATVGYVLAFALGVHWGIVGVAAAALGAGLVLEPLSLVLCARALGLSPWRWFASVGGVLEAGIGMMLVLVVVREALRQTALGPGPRLGLLVVTAIAVYAPLLLWRAGEVLEEVRRVRAGGGAAAATP